MAIETGFSSATTIADAQRDMRMAYVSGAPGIFVSALAWLLAGCVAWSMSPQKAVIALFVGGMCIHPVSLLLVKLLGRSGKHGAGNPLGALAMETTVWLILCMPVTYAVSLYRVDWFFPAMLVMIGGRYCIFATLFGNRWYWACAAALIGAAWLLVSMRASPTLAALSGSAIEAVFAVMIFAQARREQ
ncbi:hypothetical protein [Tahibacter sp.]|uniref:DUF7010 family protein n=1 Tax=Tahibacter sp. TaxID=2056211 RepID=UPI0028C438FA|nr:hypothetical protein [Tahibacter sp.]